MAKINYNGIELEEVTEPQIFDPPKKCVVFDSYDEKKSIIRNVVAVLPASFNKSVGMQSVITEEKQYWKHCAILPENPAPRMATNRELAMWLAQGNGEWGISKFGVIEKAEIGWFYDTGYEKQALQSELRVRKWDDNEWHTPDVEYMGITEVENKCKR